MRKQEVTDVLRPWEVEQMITYSMRHVMGRGGKGDEDVQRYVKICIPVVSDNELWAWDRTLEEYFDIAERTADYTREEYTASDRQWAGIWDRIKSEIERRERHDVRR